jgi:putative copper resistance protein D
MSFGVWDAAEVAVKAIAYAATLGASGAVFFLIHSHSLIAGPELVRIVRLVRRSSVIAVIAGCAQIMATAGSISGNAADLVSPPLLSMVSQTDLGPAIAIRAAGLLFANIGTSPPHRPTWPAGVGAAAAATSFAWVGHTHSLAPHLAPILLVGIHLCAAAFWLGALAPLLTVSQSGDLAIAAAAAERFGAAAHYVVGALVAAGLSLLWLMLGSVSELWMSAYGRCLMVKLVLVAGLLYCAALNKLRWTPRLTAGDTAALQSLRTSIRLEISLGVLILMATAALTTLNGPPALE